MFISLKSISKVVNIKQDVLVVPEILELLQKEKDINGAVLTILISFLYDGKRIINHEAQHFSYTDVDNKYHIFRWKETTEAYLIDIPPDDEII